MWLGCYCCHGVQRQLGDEVNKVRMRSQAWRYFAGRAQFGKRTVIEYYCGALMFP